MESPRESRIGWETYGSCEFGKVFECVCELPQVEELARQEPDLHLFPHDSNLVFRRYKSVVKEIIWGSKYDILGKLFKSDENEVISGRLSKIVPIDEEFTLNQIFLITMTSGKELKVKIDEELFFSEIYENPAIYEDIGKEMCISLDVVLAASGCEAVVEGFYSLVKEHKKNGGQLNASLIQRSVVDWVLPHPIQCPNTVKNITKLYTDGNKERALRPHRNTKFFDSRQRASGKYKVSKVVDRLAQQTVKCPHVLSEDDH